MEPTALALLLVASCILICLIVLAHERQKRKRREWHESLVAQPESLPPLNLYRPPDDSVFGPISTAPPTPRARAEHQLGTTSEFLLKLPDMRDDWSASAPQRELLKRWLAAELALADITRRQASLVLDICAYVNGFWWMKTGEDATPSVRVILVSEILADEEVWRAIRAWGRGRYSTGRDSKRPTLAPNSPLFRKVWAVVQRAAAKDRPGIR